MGLKVSTISRLPIDSDRDYFVYFLDYGWDEPYSDALYRNFDNFAEGLSGHKGVVVAGLHRREFADEVLSWHAINGEPAENLLPAILVSGCHPEEFRAAADSHSWKNEHGGVHRHDGAMLIPLREVCKSPDDVVPVISSILFSIRKKKKVDSFQISQRLNDKSRPSDMFVLRPSVAGIGVDLKEIWKVTKPFFSKKPASDIEKSDTR